LSIWREAQTRISTYRFGENMSLENLLPEFFQRHPYLGWRAFFTSVCPLAGLKFGIPNVVTVANTAWEIDTAVLVHLWRPDGEGQPAHFNPIGEVEWAVLGKDNLPHRDPSVPSAIFAAVVPKESAVTVEVFGTSLVDGVPGYVTLQSLHAGTFGFARIPCKRSPSSSELLLDLPFRTAFVSRLYLPFDANDRQARVRIINLHDSSQHPFRRFTIAVSYDSSRLAVVKEVEVAAGALADVPLGPEIVNCSGLLSVEPSAGFQVNGIRNFSAAMMSASQEKMPLVTDLGDR
jgi:hypothetical protein